MAHKTPVDYLLIGHITQDLTPQGPMLGGTASYASRTAQAMGLRVGLLTSARAGEPLLHSATLNGLEMVVLPAPATTTFTNIYEDGHRRQVLSARARTLSPADVPPAWARAPIVHMGPLVREVEPALVGHFSGAFVGITPQGWMRQWDDAGVVSYRRWEEAPDLLPLASAVVLSQEDLNRERELIDQYARLGRMVVLTRGAEGADVYLEGEAHHVPTRSVEVVDPTGAGDIFAAVFFARMQRHPDNPIDAARLAVYVATTSVTRPGLEGAPTRAEVIEALRLLNLKE